MLRLYLLNSSNWPLYVLSYFAARSRRCGGSRLEAVGPVTLDSATTSTNPFLQPLLNLRFISRGKQPFPTFYHPSSLFYFTCSHSFISHVLFSYYSFSVEKEESPLFSTQVAPVRKCRIRNASFNTLMATFLSVFSGFSGFLFSLDAV